MFSTQLNRPKTLFYLFLSLLALATLLNHPAPAKAAGPSHGKHVVMYYPDWAGNPDISSVANKVTHLEYAFINLDSNGNCVAPASNSTINYLKNLKASYPHLKLLFSVGGWTWSDNFSLVAKDATKRARMVSTCLTLSRNSGFDGIDIDWEHPGGGGEAGNSVDPNDHANYVLLLQAFRNAMQPGEELSVATSAAAWVYNSMQLANMATYLDTINIMTYDFHGGWESKTMHHSSLYRNPLDPIADNGNKAVTDYIAAGVPANKIILGVAFYGVTWKGVSAGTTNGLNQNGTSNGALTYDQIKPLIGTNGYVRYWDDVAKVPYVYSPTANGGTFIAYDDTQSACVKSEYAKTKNLAGIMAWEITQNMNNSDMLTSIDNCLGSGAATATPAPTATKTPTLAPGVTPTVTKTPLPTATPTKTPLPTATPVAGSCSAPQYIAGYAYAPADKVSNKGKQYECRPYPNSGWCSGAASAYEPGVGFAWADAWIDLGACTVSGTATPTPAATATKTPTPAATATKTSTPAATATKTSTPVATATTAPVATATTTPSASAALHVSALNGTATQTSSTKWTATAIITVANQNNVPVSGVTVTGRWSGGATGTATCITNASGVCSLAKTGLLNSKVPVMTVKSLALTGYTYNSAANVYNSVRISLSGIVLSEDIPDEVPTAVTVDQNNVTQASLITPVVVVGLILSAVILWGVRRSSAESL